jgi:hypothetical protein
MPADMMTGMPLALSRPAASSIARPMVEQVPVAPIGFPASDMVTAATGA